MMFTKQEKSILLEILREELNRAEKYGNSEALEKIKGLYMKVQQIVTSTSTMD
ncbi:MAG: hypothetical protein NUV49_04330 [Patescibacteria group bacterium]|nr:hypothetical protein [Patescibacteria group bacterium]